MIRQSRPGVLLLLLILFAVVPAMAIDIKQVEGELAGAGAEGWIHGSVKEKGLYVFTYRNPKDFFDYLEISLVARDTTMQARLASFKRHDKVRVKGAFLVNPSPQKHVLVSSIELIKKYEPKYASEAYQYNSKLPEDLLRKHKGVFLVHAIAEDGHILVLEYRDAVVPLFAPDNSLIKDLSRNDIIQLKYTVSKVPNRPVHLEIDKDAKSPVEIIESIKDINGNPASVEGSLVLFPKSPEISVNVFAVLQTTKGGFNRQYTIVNFEKPEVFKATREKLQKAWDDHPGEYVNGRNKLVSKKLRVKVTGTFNQVDPNQANPQILISSPDDVQIIAGTD